MPDTTPTYELPFYVTATDPPDLGDATEQLALAVEDELERIDGDVADLLKLKSTTYSGTTDANGYLTVSHGAGATPLGGWAVNTSITTSFASFWGIDSLTSTTVRVRFFHVNSGQIQAATAVSGRLFVVLP